MNRRLFLRRATIVAAGVAVADELELLERFAHSRRLFPSAAFPEQDRLLAHFIGVDFAAPGAEQTRMLLYKTDPTGAFALFADPDPMPAGIGRVARIEHFHGPRRVQAWEPDWMNGLQFSGRTHLEIGLSRPLNESDYLAGRPNMVAGHSPTGRILTPGTHPVAVTHSWMNRAGEDLGTLQMSRIGWGPDDARPTPLRFVETGELQPRFWEGPVLVRHRPLTLL